MGGEDVTLEAFTEVLHHVVTLGLTVDVDVQVKLVLDLDDLLDLLLNELLVLLRGDFTLDKLVAVDADLLGLRERTDGGSREDGELEVLLLLGVTGRESRLALVHLSGDLGLSLLDLGVVGTGRRSACLHRLGVSLELLADSGRALSDGLGNDGNLNGLLGGEREPVLNFLRKRLLAVKSVGSVEERAGGGNNDTVLAELLDGSLDELDGLLEVGLPDVTAVNDTSRKDLLGAEVVNDLLELLGVANKVDVDGRDILEGCVNNVKVVYNVTEVGGKDELRAGSGELLVCGLEGLLDLGRKIEDENGLIDLDRLGTGLLQLLQELNVDGEKLLKESDGLDALATVGLAEGEERDGTQEDGASGDTGLLGLLELTDGLRVGVELEGLVVLESGLDVVVVGVKPLDHLQRGDIDTITLVSTTHGEVLVNGLEAVLSVTLRGSLEGISR